MSGAFVLVALAVPVLAETGQTQPVSSPGPAAVPDVNCEKPKTRVERVVCGDGALLSMGRSISELYLESLRVTTSPADEARSRFEWLQRVDKCNKRRGQDLQDCVLSAYRERAEQLGSRISDLNALASEREAVAQRAEALAQTARDAANRRDSAERLEPTPTIGLNEGEPASVGAASSQRPAASDSGNKPAQPVQSGLTQGPATEESTTSPSSTTDLPTAPASGGDHRWTFLQWVEAVGLSAAMCLAAFLLFRFRMPQTVPNLQARQQEIYTTVLRSSRFLAGAAGVVISLVAGNDLAPPEAIAAGLLGIVLYAPAQRLAFFYLAGQAKCDSCGQRFAVRQTYSKKDLLTAVPRTATVESSVDHNGRKNYRTSNWTEKTYKLIRYYVCVQCGATTSTESMWTQKEDESSYLHH